MFFGNAPGKSLDVLIERLSTLGLAREQVPPLSLRAKERSRFGFPHLFHNGRRKVRSQNGNGQRRHGSGAFPPAAEVQASCM
jgi:hypothetical protein